MRLIYRGANYEYNSPALETRETDLLRRHQGAYQRCKTLQEASYPLTYRGVRYTTDQVAEALLSTPTLRTPQRLVYRGQQYIKHPNGAIETVVAEKATRVPDTTAELFREVNRVHQENLRRNLQHRLLMAKQQGNQALVSLLEAESKQLAL
jgi:hypothetical protein